MIQDLHSHTRYSFCSRNPSIEEGVLAAIEGEIELFGITDHNYGIGYVTCEDFLSGNTPSLREYQRRIDEYRETICTLKKKYEPQIKILSGIELATTLPDKNYPLPKGIDVSRFDYCLIENLTNADSIMEGDLFSYAKSLRCPAGVAHTDLFAFIQNRGENPLDYFRRMAEENIFWELNVNYDSIHHFREHEYVKTFFDDERQQEIIRKSGVKLSVGFDGHDASEYNALRVRSANERLKKLEIPLAFDNR